MSVFEEISLAAAEQKCRHHYCLRYLGNEQGVDKVIEFRAPSVTQAIEYALQDPARRSVEIREDENFVCMLGREPNCHGDQAAKRQAQAQTSDRCANR